KPKYRDAPLVLDARVDLAIGVLVGDHFAAAIEVDEGSVVAAHVLFELHPIAAAGQPFHARTGSVPRHPLAAAELDMIAASERKLAGALLPVEPPGNIQLIAIGSVLIERRQALEERNLPARAAAHRIHQVSPDPAARVGESIRELFAFGIEQNAHRFAGTGREDHYLCASVLRLAGG